SYAIDAVTAVTKGDEDWTLWGPLIVIAAVSAVALALAAATLRRRTP
ncbi:antibiotic ABC transporter permease, partial [Leucobacter sp. OLES1]